MNVSSPRSDDGWTPPLTTRVRFTTLLGTLVALLFVPTLLPSLGFPMSGALAEGVVLTLFLAVVLSSVLAVAETRRAVTWSGALAGAVVLTRLAPLFLDEPALRTTNLWLSIALLAHVTWLLLVHLLRARTASMETIAAALCVYLLLAVVWALGYVLVDVVEPGSFRASMVAGGTPFMRLSGDSSFYPLYYSLVTLTTLGYGDIVPVSRTASMLAALEAIVGQIYLTVLVARLVGLHVARQES